jgi:dolichol-phosphate mannosyltransferase
MHEIVVLIPTYNEARSIVDLLKKLKKLSIDVIVIDDDSPDSTSAIVKELAYTHVKVINNGPKNGIGNAYISGFKSACDVGYKKIATMDADGSHSVENLEQMITLSSTSDVVMGTRWTKGGSVTNWSFHRQLLSQFGTWYARKCLGVPYKDLTGGLRIYDLKLLQRMNFSAIQSNGYCFQIEMIRASVSLNARILEHPIQFVERTDGVSKMSRNIVLEAFYRVSIWGFKRMLRLNADKLHYVK